MASMALELDRMGKKERKSEARRICVFHARRANNAWANELPHWNLTRTWKDVHEWMCHDVSLPKQRYIRTKTSIHPYILRTTYLYTI